MWELYELGLGDDIHFCSAAHNRGSWDISGEVEQALAVNTQSSTEKIDQKID